MSRRQLTRGRSLVPAAFPLRHPFVYIGCPVVMLVAAVQFDGISLLIGLTLCVVLVAVAWPPEATPRLVAEDFAGYPYDDESLARAWVDEEAVTYELETGEVVEEIEAPERRQIGAGR